MQIRNATPGDAATLLRFIRELAEYEREPDAVEVTEEMLAAQLSEATPPFECLLAEVGGEAVGFALFFHTYSTWRGRRGLWLEDLWVTPDARKQGVGGRLLAECARTAAQRGCARFEWAVLDWNELAMGFYRSLGAVPLEEWTRWRLDGGALAAMAAR